MTAGVSEQSVTVTTFISPAQCRDDFSASPIEHKECRSLCISYHFMIRTSNVYKQPFLQYEKQKFNKIVLEYINQYIIVLEYSIDIFI